MKNNIFANMELPIALRGAADGAVVQLIQEPVIEEAVEPFFGGYADDFLADLGFDMVDEASAKAVKVKQV